MMAIALKPRKAHAMMRKCLEACNGDVDTATKAYLQSIDTNQLRAELFPIVRMKVYQLQRVLTRAVERRVSDSGLEHGSMGLTGMFFALPDGSIVYWEKATAEQHEERARWQRDLAAGCIQDAELHEQAAALLRERGVDCLEDLE